MGDEEVHVVVAMLRNNITIEELQFRRNNIGDDGARAIAAVLAERSALKLVDLRENRISMIGVKVIADALERSERIHKVMVHPGGKIEAFGASETIGESESAAFAVRTVCVVDIRENQPKPTNEPSQKKKTSVSRQKKVKPGKSGKSRASSAGKENTAKSAAAQSEKLERQSR